MFSIWHMLTVEKSLITWGCKRTNHHYLCAQLQRIVSQHRRISLILPTMPLHGRCCHKKSRRLHFERFLTCEKQVPTSQLVRLVVAENDPSNLTCAELNILVFFFSPSSSAVGTTMVVEKSQSARNRQWKSFLMW